MIAVPPFACAPLACLYHDSDDDQSIYVDTLEPSPVRGESAIRWLPMPNATAYLVGEVRFGPGVEGFGDITALTPGQRPVPMPWEIVPVFAWYREGDGVKVVARGKTSGFAQSNAVFNGTAPAGAMISPVLVGAELVCRARLARAKVTGMGRPDDIVQALQSAAWGEGATWNQALGEALAELLSRLVDSGGLALQVQVDEPTPEIAEMQIAALRRLSLLEWAHRLVASVAPELTLGSPAALLKPWTIGSIPSFELSWTHGSTTSLRAVRVWRPQDMERRVPPI